MALLLMGTAMASDLKKSVRPVKDLAFHPVVGQVDFSNLVQPVPAKLAKGVKVKLPAKYAVQKMEYPELEANEALCWYYGDLLGNGTAFYLLVLADQCGISSNGAPLTEGHMMRLFISAPMPDDVTHPELPAGEYVGSDSYDIGTITLSSCDFLDVFYYDVDSDGVDDLVGYIYDITDAQAEIDLEDEYSIAAECDIDLTTDEGEHLATGYAEMSYNGTVSCNIYDPSAYPAMDSDYEMTINGVSGRYTEGNFSLAFYSVELDEDGFIIGGGDLMNVELLTPDNHPADYSTLAGTYTCSDFYGGSYPAGTFVGGAWYNIMDGYYAAVGTAMSVYDSNTDIEKVALATGGTITIIDKGNGIFAFDFDLITAEDHKLTGHWEGPLANFVEDMTATSIQTPSASNGTSDASSYDLSGMRHTNASPSGIRIVKRDGKYIKVLR